MHVNWNVEHALTPKLFVGIGGYWLRQFTDTEIDGHPVSGRRERVWALGAGFAYAWAPNPSIILNAYVERGARNRAQGNRFVLRYVHHFARGMQE